MAEEWKKRKYEEEYQTFEEDCRLEFFFMFSVRENASVCFVITSFHYLKGKICSTIMKQNSKGSVQTSQNFKS